MASIALDTAYDTSSVAIYVRNKVTQKVVLLAKGEKVAMQNLASQLERSLDIPRR